MLNDKLWLLTFSYIMTFCVDAAVTLLYVMLKVFEVNASGSRDGRYVLTQLQEATQSHQVSRGPRTDAASEQREEPITGMNETMNNL